MFGLGLAIAVFIDATIVRMVLVPVDDEPARQRQLVAAPWLDRILPHLDLEAAPEIASEPAVEVEERELEAA